MDIKSRTNQSPKKCGFLILLCLNEYRAGWTGLPGPLKGGLNKDILSIGYRVNDSFDYIES